MPNTPSLFSSGAAPVAPFSGSEAGANLPETMMATLQPRARDAGRLAGRACDLSHQSGRPKVLAVHTTLRRGTMRYVAINVCIRAWRANGAENTRPFFAGA